jgi:RNA-directed DNA polymerase
VDAVWSYLLGWKAYFSMAQTPKVWRELDEWLRDRTAGGRQLSMLVA